MRASKFTLADWQEEGCKWTDHYDYMDELRCSMMGLDELSSGECGSV